MRSPTAAPDLIHLAAQHLASNEAVGVKGLSVAPGLARRAIDLGYRSQLDDEGYAPESRSDARWARDRGLLWTRS